jgi:hypothetical protein
MYKVTFAAVRLLGVFGLYNHTPCTGNVSAWLYLEEVGVRVKINKIF